MAEIRPFQGMRYNQELINDLSSVICPPYDIITLQIAQELHHRSEYNFVRLEYGWQLPPEASRGDKYARSAATLEKWLKLGVIKMDEASAIYLHDHYFTCQGKDCRRRGMITVVRLEEWNKMVIRPHEGTRGEAKDDRLSLLWALGVNTSPILTLFEDQGQQVSSLLALETRNEPIISLSSATEGRHNIWAITKPEVISQICANLTNKPLYIADGHHRYESALNYQRERQACSLSVSGDEEFNFVMMTLVDFSDPGLIILPPHRLVRGISRATLSELRAKLESFFEVEELPLSTPSVWQQVDNLLAKENIHQAKLILFGLSPECLLVLRLRSFNAVSQMMPYFHGEMYKRLDISILDHIILEEMLGLNSEGEVSLTFSYDRLDAVNRVLDQEYQLAFLVNSVKVGEIKAIADAGDRMPRKSTYFYPKPPAGLVFHRLV